MFKTLFFFIFIYSITITSASKNKPQIDVYIEVLCPDTQYFIKNSFAKYLKNPSYRELANISFIPFGNGKEYKVGNRYKFTCQHGPNECYGNTVSVCALNKLSYKKGLDFIVCFEKVIPLYRNKNLF